MGNDALLHKLQEENDKLRRERTSYKLDKEAYKGTIDSLKADIMVAQIEIDDEKKLNEWLEYFSAYIYRKDKDMYDKASNRAYQLLKINIKGEEGDERRKEILEQESKRSVGGKKDSKSRVDE